MSLLSLRWKAALPGLHTPLQSKLKMLPLHDNSIRCWRCRKYKAVSFRETFLGVGGVHPGEGVLLHAGLCGVSETQGVGRYQLDEFRTVFCAFGVPSSTPASVDQANCSHFPSAHTIF